MNTMIRIIGHKALRAPALGVLIGMLVSCDMVKEKMGGSNKDLTALDTQLKSELRTDVKSKLNNKTDLEVTLKDVGPGGNQKDFARAVAEFARVYYAHPDSLKRITVQVTDTAGKNPTPFTWTIVQLANETAAAEKARMDMARADSIANAPPPSPTTKTKASPTKAPTTKAPPAPAPATKTPATKTPPTKTP